MRSSSQKGFTFIEVMVVLAIMIVLSVVVVVNLPQRKSLADLNTTGQQVMTLLREAQSRSMAGDSGATWGVYFSNTGGTPFYALYKNTYSAANTVGSYPLPADLQFVTSTVASGSSTFITFAQTSGLPLASTSISMQLVPAGNVYAINISAQGLVSNTTSTVVAGGGGGGGGGGVPGTPGTPTYMNVTSTSLTVNWTAATNNPSYYTLQRATSSGGPYGQVTTTTLLTYGDSGLTGNTVYWYEVAGTNASGTGSYSAPSSVTTVATGNLGSWATTTKMPTIVCCNAAVVYNGYMYTVAGANGNPPTSTVAFAPINSTGSLGAWQMTTSLPDILDYFSAVVNNGYIYTIGGNDGSAINTVYYAPINSTGSLGAWKTTTQLPKSLLYTSAVVYNGYIYTTGGWDGNLSQAVSNVYYAPINSTGSLGAWQTTTALPSTLIYHSAVVYNGYIYTTGGDNGSFAPTSTVFYAPINSTGSLGAWSMTTKLPSALENHSALVNNGYIYTVGGHSSNGIPTSTVFYAPVNSTGSLGAWSISTPLPSALDWFSAVVNNGYIYSAGGETSSNNTSTVYYAPLN